MPVAVAPAAAKRVAVPATRASRRPLLLPAVFIAALGAMLWLPRIGEHELLALSFKGAVATLAAWWAWLAATGRRRRFALEVSLRPQHYLQAIAHASILVYWSFYWTPIRDAAPLLVAQLLFAYAVDILLAWTRRETYALGFGPFPIVFSTNLFLRFRDEWFYWQFVMIAGGFFAKALIRWYRDGRKVHIFNPSSLPLAVASLILILTGTTQMTWGEEIATTLFQPPHIFLFIFLVALPGQYLFGVSTMTLPAVLSTYLFGLAYYAATGTYFFVDDYIPIAVFLGMHLLFTDPSTSPRSELGRILFGVMYGLSVVALYTLLGRMGAPTFYDKLLQVPIMNLLVIAIDRAARSAPLNRFDPARLGRALVPRQRNLVYTSLWIVTFGAMTYAQGVGDHHPGHSVHFWQNACGAGKYKACETLGHIYTTRCRQGSGWACNELGVLRSDGPGADRAAASAAFTQGCRAGFRQACANTQAGQPQQAPPTFADYALLLREGKGALPSQTPVQRFEAACAKGWTDACGSLAGAYRVGDGVPADKAKALGMLTDACDKGSAQSCADAGLMHKLGEGGTADGGKALAFLKRSCDLGMAKACRWLADEQR